jgi:hypothetical protein
MPVSRICAVIAIVVSMLACAIPAAERPRLLVLTDIGNEPDDDMSMVRLLTYANEFDIEALVATTSRHLKKEVRPQLIHQHIDLYGQVRSNLLLHAPGYPTAEALHAAVVSGRTDFGMAGVGEGKDSEGSERIIAVVDRADARPVYVTVWGGPNALAQALWKVRATRSADGLAAFLDKILVYAISDQDDSGPWIRAQFPDLRYIVSPGTDYASSTWSGISGDRLHKFNGPDFDLVSNDWVHQHVQQGHGPLGASYPDIRYLMEGDTPSWFYVLPFGPGDPAHPDWGGWGGRYEHRARGLWSDAADRVLGADGMWHTSNKATVWRWRRDYQNDFAARMDWNVRPFAEANHPPSVLVRGDARRTVASGATIALDATGTSDPDGDALTYRWWFYDEPSTYHGAVEISDADHACASLHAPAVTEACDLHILLTVTDHGTPALSRYRRIIMTVTPAKTGP